MIKERTRIVSSSFLVADLVATATAFAAAHWVRTLLGRVADQWLGPVYPFGRYAPLLALILPLWGLGFAAVGLYGRRGSLGLRTDASRLLRGVAICGSILVFLIFTLKLEYVSRPVVLLFLFLDALAVEAGRRFVRGFVLGAHADRRVLVAGGRDEVLRAAAHADGHRDWGLRVVGLISDGSWDDPGSSEHRLLGTLHEVPDLVQQHIVDEVIVAPAGGRMDRIDGFDRVFARLHELGIAVCLLVNFLPNAGVDVSFAEFGGMPMLTFSNAPRNEAVLFIRRCADALLAAVLLLVLSPVFVLIAIAIKATSRGTVLFRQTRCGLNGRLFTFLKFRSMHVGADALKPSLAPYNEMDGPAFKMSNDPRVTSVGRILRKTSLDELPQLWNILRGDMSFVGPRPAVVEEVRQYEPWQRRRLSMKPGLTCLWQVSGRNQLSFDDWMRLDLEYIDNWSLWLDVKIALKTIPAVLLGKGAK